LDCRGGVAIGDDVTIASDTQIVGGTHDVNHPDFPPILIPIVIEDYVWIASRAMILQTHIHRGPSWPRTQSSTATSVNSRSSAACRPRSSKAGSGRVAIQRRIQASVQLTYGVSVGTGGV